MGENGKRKGDEDALARQELLTRSEFLDVALSVMGIEGEPKASCEMRASGELQQSAPARKFRSGPPGL